MSDEQQSTYAPPSGDPDPEVSIAQAIQEITERATLLVQEEIELAKAELSQKLAKLIKGAVVGAAASVFVIGALIMLLNGTAWFIYWTDLWWSGDQIFWGFFLTAAILLVLAALAGWIAARAFKAGSPPIPEMAIEEAQRIKETVSRSEPGSS